MSKIIFFILLILFCSCQKLPITNDASELKTIDQHQLTAKKFVIASQGRNTSRIAREIYQHGGNLVDAAVAASFAISVERPHSTGLGGGGFLLYFDPKKMKTPVSFDFRERAPLKSHKNIYLDQKGEVIPNKSLEGIYSVAVPGLVKGLYQFHKRYGKLPWRDLVAPSIRLAQEGFEVYPELSTAIEKTKDLLKKDPAASEIFLSGEKILKQFDLAKSLEQIAKGGERAFYQGEIAKSILATSAEHQGPLGQDDFSKYRVIDRKPVMKKIFNHEIYSMAPPSSGGVHVLQILKMMELHSKKQKLIDPLGANEINALSQSMRRAFFDRARYLGDPDFSHVPIAGMLADKYLEKTVDENNLNDDKNVTALDFESSQTTHFSLADDSGAMIATTQTINGYFGSGLVAKGTGIVLNNEMDDFAAKVGATNLFGAMGGEKNLVAAKKTPLSSMSPTIVLKNGKGVLALGTPSGTRILTCVAQTLLNRLFYGLPLSESVNLLRFHQQRWPDELRVEKEGVLKIAVLSKLNELGNKIVFKDLGCRVEAVEKNDSNLLGVADLRGQGAVEGF
jgi:gamma-glutamyltranspeptidase/glutathione hydrolase